MDNLGKTIRELRVKAGLSLTELSKRIGRSASFLSQVENDKTMPSLPVLKGLADVLGTTISYLLRESPEEPGRSEYCLIRKEERRTLTNFGQGLNLQFLSNLDRNNVIEPTIHILQSVSKSGVYTYQHDGQEFILILKGEIELHLSDKKIIMKEGDSCYFNSVAKHSFKNLLETEASHILCVSCPGFF